MQGAATRRQMRESQRYVLENFDEVLLEAKVKI